MLEINKHLKQLIAITSLLALTLVATVFFANEYSSDLANAGIAITNINHFN